MSALGASAATLMLPRSLPLTCTISSISSCFNASSHTSGQLAARMSVPKPQSCHSAWQMCGVVGDSRRSRIEKPSSATSACAAGSEAARSLCAFSSALRIFIAADTTVLNWCLPKS